MTKQIKCVIIYYENKKKQVWKKTRWIQSHNGINQNGSSYCDIVSSSNHTDKTYMKRKTKKIILDLLNFWPMTVVVPIMLILIIFAPLILN